ncbi:uncharacterized protein LOC133818638 [Humulus lupulus]|uniref:uncharacterized protein LOC133818638 n=1 Tax=Humulus lupulus TaxID=3486 RepID=UPI002B412052|nr:uncharacterized protein LOC133818638 [Humulus lupulus]
MAMNNYNWPTEHENKKVAGVLEVDHISLLTAQMASLTKQLQQNGLTTQAIQAQAIGNFPGPSNYPYSNTYTLAWKNHPNLSWKNNQGLQPQYPQHPPQHPHHQPTYGLHPRPYYDPNPRPSHLPPHPPMNPPTAQPDQLNQFMTETRSSIRNLETQMGQLAKLLSSRPQGNLPSSTKDQQATTPEQKRVTDDLQKKGNQKAEIVEPTPKLLYPQRFRKVNLNKQFSKFLMVFKKLHINIPFVETLEQMPSYVKFMNDILSKKRRIEDFETMALIEECSAILQRKLPQKLRDPSSFTIPCTIKKFQYERALCDLSASINLMPLTVYQRLGLGEACPTTMTLHLAERSIRHPRGILEDILGQALIDVRKVELRLRVQGDEVVFNVFKSLTDPRASDSCFSVSVLDEQGERSSLLRTHLS